MGQQEVLVSDHSRIATYEHCPRERWWLYEWEGRGLERVSLSLNLHVGIATHAVLQDVMEGKKGAFKDSDLHQWIRLHVLEFSNAIRERGLALEHQCVFGVRSARHCVGNSLTQLPSGHTLAHFKDRPRGFVTQLDGAFGRFVETATEVGVDVIDAYGFNFDEDFAIARFRGRQVNVFQILWPAYGVGDNSFHVADSTMKGG